ncbi:NAD(P)/FAD-dependent oxidoreductase [Roseobacteraceae bacterium S113]
MADITVRGAGIFGLSVAWACQARGARVQVIDPHGPGAGASGGVVGALAPHVPENWNDKKAFQFDSLVMAESFWAEVAEVSGADPGYARTGRIQPIADDRSLALAHDRAVSAQGLWQGMFDWRVTGDPGALAAPSATGAYIHDTLTARLHPRQATQALGAAFVRRGGRIVAQGRDEGHVLWATGVHDLDAMSAAAGRVMGNGVKGQAAVLDFDARAAPQLFAEALHFVPHGDGTLAIGSTSERQFAHATRTDDQLDDIVARARVLCPALKDAPVLARWAGLRPRARSRAPILGAHPLRDGAFIANGGFKIGFGMAPKVGAVMAALMLDGRDEIPASFRPEPLIKG